MKAIITLKNTTDGTLAFSIFNSYRNRVEKNYGIPSGVNVSVKFVDETTGESSDDITYCQFMAQTECEPFSAFVSSTNNRALDFFTTNLLGHRIPIIPSGYNNDMCIKDWNPDHVNVCDTDDEVIFNGLTEVNVKLESQKELAITFQFIKRARIVFD